MSDALDRLKQKNRPKVQPRSTRVSQKSEDIQTSRHIDINETENPIAPDFKDFSPSKREDIQISRHTNLEMSDTSSHTQKEAPEELEVKRSTFRLEVGLIGRLHRLCQDNGISREVMIESMFEYMEHNPDALNHVIGVAESKNARRQQIANRKRAKAMIEKFG